MDAAPPLLPRPGRRSSLMNSFTAYGMGEWRASQTPAPPDPEAHRYRLLRAELNRTRQAISDIQGWVRTEFL